MRASIASIIEKKTGNEKITVLTAYDYSFSSILDAAGVDIILVGDSMANVVLGMDSTVEISLDEMINHSRAVAKGSQNALVIGDMPYCSYQANPEEALDSARRFMDAGCQAVKLEWFDSALEVTSRIVKDGIPVMGHIGFTPQTADKLGGSIVQGKDFETAKRLIDQASGWKRPGASASCWNACRGRSPASSPEKLRIPTIGIGAGADCDGQVLVLNDMLGLFKRFTPKFVRIFADLHAASIAGVQKYIEEVKAGSFPSEKERFSMKEEEFEKLKQSL